VHKLSGSNDRRTVPSEVYSFEIEGLDACVDYQVSVSAVNENNESTEAVTNNTTTETAGNYYAQTI
jgi:hypothetical protein